MAGQLADCVDTHKCQRRVASWLASMALERAPCFANISGAMSSGRSGCFGAWHGILWICCKLSPLKPIRAKNGPPARNPKNFDGNIIAIDRELGLRPHAKIALSERDNFMIEEVNISNFRCFKHLELSGLKKINLIVGANSSGKSAFLESIFLSSGSLAPNVVFQMRGIRKMGSQVFVPNDAQTYRGLWEDLFFDFRQDKRVSIKMLGNPNSDSRSLAIQYVTPAGMQELPFGKQSDSGRDNTQQIGGMPQVEFTWKRASHPQVVSKPRIATTGLQFDVPNVDFFPCLWFTPGVSETPDENAKRFSELDKIGATGAVSRALEKEFPFIKGLSINYHAGIPMVFAELDGKSRKLPVPLVSDGVNRLLGICLGLATFKGGTVLIDQIEDGFHHKLLPSIWNSIYSLAAEFKVQLFISTHSEECIRAMQTVLRDHEGDFTLLRAMRKDSGCSISSMDGNYLETALEQNFEVR